MGLNRGPKVLEVLVRPLGLEPRTCRYVQASEALRPATLRPARGTETEPAENPGFQPTAFKPLTASVTGVFRGTGEEAGDEAVFTRNQLFRSKTAET